MGARGRGIAVAAALLAVGAAEPDGLSISGRVVSPGGEPFQGARITLTPVVSTYERGVIQFGGKPRPDPHSQVLSAADGSFELTAPELGLWRLRVSAEGYLPLEADLPPLVEPRVLASAELRPAVDVTVRVENPEGLPLAGAAVVASDAGSRRGPRRVWRIGRRLAFTGEDGIARLPKGTDALVALRTLAPGHLESERLESRGAEARLVAPQGDARILEVRDERGRPLPEALVRFGEYALPVGLTDENGRLTIPAAQGTKTQLHAELANGLLGSISWSELPPLSDRPLVLTVPDGVELAGRVLDATHRRPVAGALVWAGGNPTLSAVTAADGSFAMVSRPDANSWVTAAAPGYFEEYARRDEGAEHDLVIALRPTAAVRGEVVDADGAPLEGVELRPVAGPGARQRTADAAHTDARGAFALRRLEAGVSYRIEARRPDFAPTVLPVPALEPHSTRAGLRLVLLRGLSAYGRVVGPDGDGVANVTLTLKPSPASESRAAFVLSMRHSDADSPETVTDGEGHFELAHLNPGRYDLEAGAQGFATRRVSGVELGEGQGAVDLGTVELAAGVRVEGRVTDTGGMPIEGAEVTALSSDSIRTLRRQMRGEPPTADGTTDEEGMFIIEDRAPGERVNLEVEATGYAKAYVPGVVAPSTVPLAVELLETSSISGRVVDSSGRPVAEARVSVDPQMRPGNFTVWSSGGEASRDETGEDGRFRLEEVPPGDVTLSARADGYQDGRLADLAVEPGGELTHVEVVLSPGAVLAGRVTGPDGEPISRAFVMEESMRPGGSRVGARTDGDGRYRIDNVGPGLKTFTVHAQALALIRREIEVVAGENRLDFAYEAGLSISGRVVDATGAPVPGASVSIEPTAVTINTRGAETDVDGSFELQGVGDGSHHLTARAAGHPERRHPEPVVVAGSPVSGIVIRFEVGSSIVGRITGVDETELSAVRLWAQGEGSQHSMGTASHDGTYRIEGVAPGSWTVTAFVEASGRQARGRVIVEEGPPEVVLDLEFGAGLMLQGRVLREGKGVAGVGVLVAGIDTTFNGFAQTDHEGAFTVEDLQPGKFSVTMTAGGLRTLHQEEIELDDDHYLEVTLETASIRGTVYDAATLEPLPGVTVRLQTPEARDLGGWLPPAATTDARGAFRVGNVPAGEQRFQFELKGYATEERVVAVSEGLDVENLEVLLSPNSGLTLRATLSTGGTPRELQVALLDASGRPVTVSSLALRDDGTFRFTTAPPGSWQLLVSAGGTATERLPVSVPSDEIPIVLSPAARLEIQVPELFDSGARATATLTGADGNPFHGLSSSIRLEWELHYGRASIDDLPAGEWSVTVKAHDGRSWQTRVSTRPLEVTHAVLGTP